MTASTILVIVFLYCWYSFFLGILGLMFIDYRKDRCTSQTFLELLNERFTQESIKEGFEIAFARRNLKETFFVVVMFSIVGLVVFFASILPISIVKKLQL